MKKLNKWQKAGLALAFCAVAGSAHAEGTSATTIITALQTDVLAVVAALVALVTAVITAASVIWLSILAYKRGRAASKSVAS